MAHASTHGATTARFDNTHMIKLTSARAHIITIATYNNKQQVEAASTSCKQQHKQTEETKPTKASAIALEHTSSNSRAQTTRFATHPQAQLKLEMTYNYHYKASWMYMQSYV